MDKAHFRVQCKQSLHKKYLIFIHLIHYTSKRSDEPTKDKLCDFVEEYIHFDNISKMSEGKFIKSYQKWAKKKGYHQSESKAKEIYALSHEGIPTLSSNLPSTKMLVLEAVRVLKEINKTLELIF